MSTPAKPSPDLTISALVDPRHQHIFDKALEKAAAGSDVGVYNFLHTSPASHGDRLTLELAFTCWRGYGPAVAMDQLWGMDAKVAERLLAGLAMAMGGTDAPVLLAQAAERCGALLPKPQDTSE